jgi:hypothetical protein
MVAGAAAAGAQDIASFDIERIGTPPVHYQWQPFAVTITARTASGEVASSFDGSAALRGEAPGVSAYHFGFEEGISRDGFYTPWKPGHFWDGRYALRDLDLDGDGILSPAACAALDNGFSDSLERSVTYRGGVRYQVEVRVGLHNLGSTPYVLGGTLSTFQLFLAGGIAGWIAFEDFTPVAPGQVESRMLTGSMTALDGAYPTGVSIYTLANADSQVWACFDDMVITPMLISPQVAGPFTNGVWTGSVSAESILDGMTIVADDGAGHTGTGAPFDVWPVTSMEVVLPPAVAEGDGLLPGAGSIVVTVAAPEDRTIRLESSRPEEMTVPPWVVLAAGTTSTVFDLHVVDDDRLDGAQALTVLAAADQGYSPHNAWTQVQDNESASVTVELPPEITEGTGTVADAGRVTASRAPDADILIGLQTSDPTELSLPALITLPAGSTAVTFPITAVDDFFFDGPQAVTVTAQVASWVPGAAVIDVLDNETNNLTLRVLYQTQNEPPGSVPSVVEAEATYENILEVRVAGLLDEPLTVTLASDDTGEIEVAPTVVLPAGHVNTIARTAIVIHDDLEKDGTREVRITAGAPGFTGAETAFRVLDDELHAIRFGAIPSPLAVGQQILVQVFPVAIDEVVIARYNTPVTFRAESPDAPVGISPTGPMTPRIWPTWIAFSLLHADSAVRIVATAEGQDLGASSLFEVEPAPVADTDIDGQDDAWEHTHFKELHHPDGDPDDDPDGDGVPNRIEQRADTDPRDPASAPVIRRVGPASVLLDTSAGRRYRLWRAETVSSLPGVPAGPILLGTGAPLWLFDPSPGQTPPSAFYQAEILP